MRSENNQFGEDQKGKVMGRCKDCKFWERYQRTMDDPISEYFGYCNCEYLDYTGEPEDVYSLGEDLSKTLRYWPNEPYDSSAELIVGKNFGCVHFEPRKEKI